MRYWDASAIVPLLVCQDRTSEVEQLLELDSEMVTWWGTPIECVSAVARLAREGGLDAEGVQDAELRLQALRHCWDEVTPSEACRRTAERMLRVHVLRAADSLQLAAALVAADHDPSRVELVCLDQRLSEAARKEGFPLTIRV